MPNCASTRAARHIAKALMAINADLTGRRAWLAGALLVVMTLLAYQPIWRGFFIWDDNLLIVYNPLLHQPDGWWRVWYTKVVDFVPAVSTAWWLEWHLWGIAPAPYHLVNLCMHALNAVLLWRVLRRLQIAGAWLGAALFALHPVNVETAAWVAEQKNTMALGFMLGAALLYLTFEDSGRRRWYWLSAGAFLLALAAKTAVAPFPAVLLGAALWRRGRLTRADLLRSSVFFALAAAGVVTAWWIQHGAAGLGAVAQRGLAARTAGAGWAIWFYLYKVLLPVRLLSVYPKWTINAANPLSYVPAALAALVLVAAWCLRRGWGKAVLFGFGYYVVMLSPVLGFFDISFMREAWVADHWQYFAIIGPLALIAAAIQTHPRALPVALLLLPLCAVLTWRQARIYVDANTFWGAFVQANRTALDDYNRGCALLNQGKLDEAAAKFRNAIALQPAFGLAYNNLGKILLQQGRIDPALQALTQAADLRPELAEVQSGLGDALLAKGRVGEALDRFDSAARGQPDKPAMQRKMGTVLLQHGLAADALPYLQKAVDLAPADSESQFQLANALLQTGHARDAIAHYQEALQQRPDFPAAENNLAWILAASPDSSLRDGAKALVLAQRARELSGGNDPAILGTLAAAYAEAGKFPEAIAAAQSARQLALAQTNRTLAAALEGQLRQYQGGQPFRQ